MHCSHCNAPLATGSRFCGACGRASIPTTTAVPPEPAPAQDWAGREIAGRYRIKSKLGEGGMGAVFKAEQISLKRVIALKLLKPELVSSPTLLRRFNAEAEAVAKLNHPNTVGIYDFGQDRDGTLFIAMEFVEGRSLRAALIAEGPFGTLRALYIAGQIAASLNDAHAVGIIHRDLKPDNIMLQERGKSRDIARVLDFGIAKLRDDSRMTQQSMTQAGDVLGTPQYMSPEQIRGEDIDGRADVYSLGAIMYEMLTGRMVFEANSLVAMLSKHLLDQPEAPSSRRPDLGIAAEVDALVLSCLAKDPRQRPASMERVGELVTALLPAYGALGSSGELLANRPGSVALPPTPTPPPPGGYLVPSTPPPVGPAPMMPPMMPPPSAPPSAAYGGSGMQPVGLVGGPPPSSYPQPPYQPPPQAGYPGYLSAPAAPGPPGPPGYLGAPGSYGGEVRPAKSSSGLWMALAAVALLAAGGTGAYFIFGRPARSSTPTEPTTPSTPSTPSGPSSPSDNPWNAGSAVAPTTPPPSGDPAVMRAPKIGNVGGTLFSASGFFRFLVPPEFSTQPQMEASPDGKATRWTFNGGSDATFATISVLASPLPSEFDANEPEAAATSFGQMLGMQLESWEWRDIQGHQALAGTYATVAKGIHVSAEAVLYVKAKGFLVVLFLCRTEDFENSEPYRDSLFTQRISW